MTIYCLLTQLGEIPYSGFLSREKNFHEFRISVVIREFSPRKSLFKRLDTVLVGVVHWVTANSRKFSTRKSIFKQFAKVFSRERKSTSEHN